eukprot:Hpha_TRINITY_DN16127_c2_g3::TRINITY_DN16127_c2_g3_i1::g.5243::m.5243
MRTGSRISPSSRPPPRAHGPPRFGVGQTGSDASSASPRRFSPAPYGSPKGSAGVLSPAASPHFGQSPGSHFSQSPASPGGRRHFRSTSNCGSPKSSDFAGSPRARAQISPGSRQANGRFLTSPLLDVGSVQAPSAGGRRRFDWNSWADIDVGSHVEVQLGVDSVPGVVIGAPAGEGDLYRVRLDNGKKCRVQRERLTVSTIQDSGLREKVPSLATSPGFQDCPVSPRPESARRSARLRVGSVPNTARSRPMSSARGSVSHRSGADLGGVAMMAQSRSGRRGSSLGNLTRYPRRSSASAAGRRSSAASLPALEPQQSTLSQTLMMAHRPSLVNQRRASGKSIVDVKREVVVHAEKRSDLRMSLGAELDGRRVIAVDQGGPADRAKLTRLIALAPDHTRITVFNGVATDDAEILHILFDMEARGAPLEVVFEAPIMIFIPSLFDDDDHTAGNCNNKFQGIEDLKWYHAITAFGKTRGRFNSLVKPLGCIGSTSVTRKRLVAIVDSKAFDRTVLVIIFANAICLGMDIPSTEDDKGVQDFLMVSEYFFLAAFTLEAALKISAMGFAGHIDSYLRSSIGGDDQTQGQDGQRRRVHPGGDSLEAEELAAKWTLNWWNIIDFTIVIFAWAGLHPSVTNVSILRAVRVLRPLRALHRVTGLQIILEALLSAIGPLANVMVMLSFFMTMFVIIGVLLWSGKWHQRCVLSTSEFLNSTLATEEDNSSAAFVGQLALGASDWILANVSQACTTNKWGMHCSSDDIGFQGGTVCRETTWMRSDYINFDNAATGALTVFKIISLDDWTDDLQVAHDTTGAAAFIYFVLLTVFGTYFTMNLVLAILFAQFSTQRLRLKRARQRRKERELYGERFKTYSYPVLCSTINFTSLRLVIAVYGSQTAMWKPNDYKMDSHRAKSIVQRVLSVLVSPGGSSAIRSPGVDSHPGGSSAIRSPESPKLIKPKPQSPPVSPESEHSDVFKGVSPFQVPPVSDTKESPFALGDPESPDVPGGGVQGFKLEQGFKFGDAEASSEDSSASASPKRTARNGLSNGKMRPPALTVLSPLSAPEATLFSPDVQCSARAVEPAESEQGPEEMTRSMTLRWFPRRGSIIAPGARPVREGEWKESTDGGSTPKSLREFYETLDFTTLAAVVLAAACASDCAGDVGYYTWLRGRGKRMVESMWFRYFISFVITFNVIVMCIDHHPIDPGLERFIEMTSLVCNFVFIIEMIIKLWALGFWFRQSDGRAGGYFSSAWNWFDCVLVCVGVPEMIIAFSTGDSASGSGLTALRAFRAFRITRVLRRIKSLEAVVRLIRVSLASATYLSLVLLLFIYVYTILGLQFFAKTYPSDERNNFSSLWQAAITVFVVTTGEGWSGIMETAMNSTNPAAAAYFLSLFLLGHYIFTNLFIAILIDKFSSVQMPQDEIGIKAEGDGDEVDDGGGIVWEPSEDESEYSDGIEEEDEEPLRGADIIDSLVLPSALRRRQSRVAEISTSPRAAAVAVVSVAAAVLAKAGPWDGSELLDMQCVTWAEDEILAARAFDELFGPEHEERRDPELRGNSLGIFSPTNGLRIALSRLVLSRAFDASVFFVICVSTVALAVQGDWMRGIREAEQANDAADLLFIILFTLEALMKIIVSGLACEHCGEKKEGEERKKREEEDSAKGDIFSESVSSDGVVDDSAEDAFARVIGIGEEDDDNDSLGEEGRQPPMVKEAEESRPYLCTPWNRVDGLVVVTSIVALAVPELRMFRVLRAVRLIIRSRNIRIVVKALMHSLPGIANVIAVTCFAFLVFAILGVQLFKGKLHYCTDTEINLRQDCVGNFTPTRCSLAASNETICGALPYCEWTAGSCVPSLTTPTSFNIWGDPQSVGNATVVMPRRWDNSRFNYDNVGEAFVSLFTVAVGEAWTDTMWEAVDARSYDQSVRHESAANSTPVHSLYFIALVVTGNFFALNLFVGLLIDQFSRKKRLQDRKRFGLWSSVFITDEQHYWISASKMINRIGLRPRYVEPSGESSWVRCRRCCYKICMYEEFETLVMVVIILNAGFMAMRHRNQSYTAAEIQDIADLVFVILFGLEAWIKISAWGGRYFKSNSNIFDFFLVITSIAGRVVSTSDLSALRILRVLRVVRLTRFRGVKDLFETLMYSFPSLLNIGLLLLCIWFCFAVMGVELFGTVRKTEGLDKWLNFDSVGNGVMLMYTLSSTELWTTVMEAVTTNTEGCEERGDCGTSRGVAVAYFLTFVVICALVTMNLFITVVLDNFVVADEDDGWNGPDGIFERLREFTELWGQHDPDATALLPAAVFIELLQDESLPMPIRLDVRDCTSAVERTTKTARHLRALAAPNPMSDYIYIPVSRRDTGEGTFVNEVRYWDCLIAVARRYSRSLSLSGGNRRGVWTDPVALEEQLDWLVRNVLLRGFAASGLIGGDLTKFTIYHFHAANRILHRWRTIRKERFARWASISGVAVLAVWCGTLLETPYEREDTAGFGLGDVGGLESEGSDSSSTEVLAGSPHNRYGRPHS